MDGAFRSGRIIHRTPQPGPADIKTALFYPASTTQFFRVYLLLAAVPSLPDTSESTSGERIRRSSVIVLYVPTVCFIPFGYMSTPPGMRNCTVSER